MIADFNGTQREIILKLCIAGSSTVLDVGCGDGEKTFYISQHVQWSVGIDPDEKSIQLARNTYKNDNLEFQVAQAESLPFSTASFDALIFSQSLHHVPIEKQIEALNEAHRVLNPKGKLLIVEPIHGSGSFGRMWKRNNDSEKRKQNAIHSIETVSFSEFLLSEKRKIQIEYHCEGFDDFYQYYLKSKPNDKWDQNRKQDIVDKLEKCEKSPDGNFILDYSAFVWLLYNN